MRDKQVNVINKCYNRVNPIVTKVSVLWNKKTEEIFCPKTKNVPLTVYIFADELTKKIGKEGKIGIKVEKGTKGMGEVHYTMEGTPFRPYEIDIELIAAWIHVIFKENKANLVVNAKGILDSKEGEKLYKYWQKHATEKMTEAYGKITGLGSDAPGASAGDYRFDGTNTEIEVNFKAILLDRPFDNGNYRYDYEYCIAYIISHEIIHWQLSMMYIFYNQPKDFYSAFGLEYHNGGNDHAYEDVFGPHLNIPYATFYFRPNHGDYERILPEQVCGIMMFLEDYTNKINKSQLESHWRKIAEIVKKIRNQRHGKN